MRAILHLVIVTLFAPLMVQLDADTIETSGPDMEERSVAEGRESPPGGGKTRRARETYGDLPLAFGGEADTHPVDDVCPRSVAPPYFVDPYPDGSIKDKGCGKQKGDGTFGDPILLDLYLGG